MSGKKASRTVEERTTIPSTSSLGSALRAQPLEGSDEGSCGELTNQKPSITWNKLSQYLLSIQEIALNGRKRPTIQRAASLATLPWQTAITLDLGPYRAATSHLGNGTWTRSSGIANELWKLSTPAW